MRQVVLTQLLAICIVQVVDILTGRPLMRLGNWIATYGEPKRDQWQPREYVEGGWR